MELAQVNVAHARSPLDDPTMRGFVFASDRLDREARASAGFVWRLDPVDQLHVDDRGRRLVVNVSVWRDAESLLAYVAGQVHGPLMARRDKWFHPMEDASNAQWWVPDGTRPTLAEALDRLDLVRGGLVEPS